jgi:hypothetical protein
MAPSLQKKPKPAGYAIPLPSAAGPPEATDNSNSYHLPRPAFSNNNIIIPATAMGATASTTTTGSINTSTRQQY